MSEQAVTGETPKKIVRVRVDRELCIGAATCLAMMSDVFELDDEQKAVMVKKDGSKTSKKTVVSDLNNEDQEALLMAAQSCPTQAIILEAEDGGQIYPEK